MSTVSPARTSISLIPKAIGLNLSSYGFCDAANIFPPAPARAKMRYFPGSSLSRLNRDSDGSRLLDKTKLGGMSNNSAVTDSPLGGRNIEPVFIELRGMLRIAAWTMAMFIVPKTFVFCGGRVGNPVSPQNPRTVPVTFAPSVLASFCAISRDINGNTMTRASICVIVTYRAFCAPIVTVTSPFNRSSSKATHPLSSVVPCKTDPSPRSTCT